MNPIDFACDEAGRLTRAIDAAGHEAWSLQWDRTRLVRAHVRLPDGTVIEIETDAADHTVLGRCDVLRLASDRETTLARIAAVSWHVPAFIPAVDIPGALPPGAGTAILNLLALLARHAGVPSLRYRGPYPTHGLFATLRASFRVDGDRDDAERVFVAALQRHGIDGNIVSPAVDFIPDPHAWSWPTPRVCLQRRRGIERVWIDGRAYDPDGEHHVLVRDDDVWSARVVLAGRLWCEVLRIDDDGVARSSIAEPPPVAPELIDVALPRAMVEVLAHVIAAEAAAPLHAAIDDVLAEGITLGDTGLALARAGPHAGGLVLHGALVERALGLEGAASIAALVAALRSIVVREAVARLQNANDSNRRSPV